MTVRLLALDFDGVLTDGKVWVLPDGSEAVRCSRADGMGIARLTALGAPIVVISQETAPIVGLRCAKLGVACYQGIPDKLAQLTLIAAAREVGLSEIAYVGNDVNDLECLKAVGHPWVVADAEPALLWALRPHMPPGSVLNHTLHNGGDGAVREVCDLLADEIEHKRDRNMGRQRADMSWNYRETTPQRYPLPDPPRQACT